MSKKIFTTKDGRIWEKSGTVWIANDGTVIEDIKRLCPDGKHQAEKNLIRLLEQTE